MPNGDPANPSVDTVAVLQQAIAFHRQGRLAEAEPLYRAVLDSEPLNFDALQLLGAVANQFGRYNEGVELITRALNVQPHHAAAQYNRGIALLALKRPDEAMTSFDRALAIRPDYIGALNNRGIALMMQKQSALALASYARALEIQPDNAEVLSNRAVALHDLRRFEDALLSAEHALQIQPDYPAALYNRANAAHELNRLDDALAGYDRTVALKPDYIDAWINRGILLVDMRQLDKARESYNRAQALDPTNAAARLNEALCRLLEGDYAQGWERYEARWDNEPLNRSIREYAAPLWTGEADIRGKTILLHAEQGLGDTIQFCRYAPLLSARGARVVLEVQAPLKTLLESLDETITVVTQTATPVDFHCPLLSLPRAFNTTLATLPAAIPYLKASPDLVDKWRARLGVRRRPRVGLVWSGGQALKNDPNRSIPLREFAKFIGSDLEFFSLQKDVREDDKAWLAAHPEIQHFGDELGDFSDTAALLIHMDLVISVDTAAAHLAGALGTPVWILLPAIGTDWRWMAAREDSPWYPTARLFRQPAAGDWDTVIARVADELATMKNVGTDR